jgi:hypothetical protein
MTVAGKRGQHLPPAQAALKKQYTRKSRLMCDCGRPAVTVKMVKVGIDPQYTIRLLLCAECIKLEQELEQDLE